MRLNKKARTAFNEVIQVDSYELVAALRHLGFEYPSRQYGWVSEEINEDCIDEAVEGSVYIYPKTPELLEAINQIKYSGIKIDRKDWKYFLDELKMQYGVGPSKLGSYEAERLPNGRFKITPLK